MVFGCVALLLEHQHLAEQAKSDLMQNLFSGNIFSNLHSNCTAHYLSLKCCDFGFNLRYDVTVVQLRSPQPARIRIFHKILPKLLTVNVLEENRKWHIFSTTCFFNQFAADRKHISHV